MPGILSTGCKVLLRKVLAYSIVSLLILHYQSMLRYKVIVRHIQRFWNPVAPLENRRATVVFSDVSLSSKRTQSHSPYSWRALHDFKVSGMLWPCTSKTEIREQGILHVSAATSAFFNNSGSTIRHLTLAILNACWSPKCARRINTCKNAPGYYDAKKRRRIVYLNNQALVICNLETKNLSRIYGFKQPRN